MSVHPLRPDTHRRLGRPLPHQQANEPQAPLKAEHPLLSALAFTLALVFGIIPCFHGVSPTSRQVTHVLLTSPPCSKEQAPLPIRLACLKRAASVRSEPGSNSPLFLYQRPKPSIPQIIKKFSFSILVIDGIFTIPLAQTTFPSLFLPMILSAPSPASFSKPRVSLRLSA